MKIKNLLLPAKNEEIESLQPGDIVSLTGIIYTARDAAHKRITESIADGKAAPFEIPGSAIYYSGPTPARKGEIIGSCGPTTSTRMDDYTPMLLEHGLKIMIGKGNRSKEVVDSIKKNRAVYLIAVGGAAALIKNCVKSCETAAYPDLGCEAVYKLYVENMQLAVAIDTRGDSIFGGRASK